MQATPSSPLRVAVAGSSGLIGRGLVKAFAQRGDDVLRLLRSASSRAGDSDSGSGSGVARWDPGASSIDATNLEGVDAAVNLAGVGIGDRRWSKQRKKAILDSRVDSTFLLSRTIAGLSSKPRILVNASAIGIYGSRGDDSLTESSAPGSGFTAEVCRAWEAATRPAQEAGIRVVHLRSAVVLARESGTLARQLPLFKVGLGGRLGRGDQW
ncbi:MAG: NAD-dependent epimerase/dehydratase family protein, partial [Acidimicrobiales bacterium]